MPYGDVNDVFYLWKVQFFWKTCHNSCIKIKIWEGNTVLLEKCGIQEKDIFFLIERWHNASENFIVFRRKKPESRRKCFTIYRKKYSKKKKKILYVSGNTFILGEKRHILKRIVVLWRKSVYLSRAHAIFWGENVFFLKEKL